MFKLLVFNERWCAGGVEALWANLIANMPDDCDCKIVFLVGKKETTIYDELLCRKDIELINMGLDGIHNPIRRDIEIVAKLKSYFEKEKADIIHINVCNAIGYKYAKIARKCGCKNVVVHSHNTKIENDKYKIKALAHRLMRCIYFDKRVYRVACSTEAGRFMFGKKKFILVNNGVNIDRFRYNETVRSQMRFKYCIERDAFVVLHVGRFAEQKNHNYLLLLFKEISRINKTAHLFLVGEGPELERIRLQVNLLDMSNNVHFMGLVKDIEKVYCMADCFILPSLHEGLPVVAVEAQTSGLQCFLADTISTEAKVVDNCHFFSLSSPKEEVAKMVLNASYSQNRASVVDEIYKNGYSIGAVSKKLFDLYKKMIGDVI